MNWKPQLPLPDEAMDGMLRNLPDRKIPGSVSVQLRMAAARERLRIVSPAPSFWAICRTRMSLGMNDLMRPLALPFAGGLLSAMALFGIGLGPTYPKQAALKSDVALSMLTTESAVYSMGEVGIPGPDVVVDVYLDGGLFTGRYNVVSGQVLDAAAKSRLENRLIQMSFTSATAFGLPTASTIRVSFQSNSVEVRG